MKQLMSLLVLASGVAMGADLAPLKTAEAKLTYLTDTQGMTAYTYDPDTTGVSNCNGGCAKAWPPIAVPAGATLAAPLSAVTRKDGSKQIAYKGHPLYLYVDDSAAGDINGDGEHGVWHVVHP